MPGLKLICIHILSLLLALPLFMKSQHEQYIDSLKKIADNHTREKRIDALLLISRRYNNLSMEKEFEKYFSLAENESRKINYKNGIASCLHLKGLFYAGKSDFSNSMKNYESALRLRTELKDSTGMSATLNNIGNSLYMQGKLPEGLEYHFQALHIRKSIKDTAGISLSLNNIGNVYYAMRNYLKALEYFQKSNHLGEISRNDLSIATSLQNIGVVYIKMEEYELARKYIEQSIPYYEKVADVRNKAGAYLSIGEILRLQKNFKEAEKYFRIALSLKKKYEDKAGIAECYLSLGQLKKDEGRINDAVKMIKSSVEISKKIGDSINVCVALLELASAYLKNGNDVSALNTLKEILEIVHKKKYQSELRDAYYQLSQVYAKMKDYPDAYKYLELYRTLNDSLNKESSTRQINELSASFENEKKEKEIELLKKTQSLKELEVKNQQAEIEKQKLYITFSVIAIVLAILSLGLLANRFYLKKKSGDQLLSAYSLLREKNKQITDSINYAQRLQSAILPGEEEIKKHLPGSFIFFRPRDIVSGDFYWFSRVKNKSIIAVADCTGHGVPGALMSMIGNTLLNQAVNEQKLDDPGEILTQLNKSLYRTFSRNNGEENPDGMDISVCAIDTASNTLSFAGANHSLFLVSGDKAEIIRGDRYSVGGVFSNPDSIFTSQKIQIKDGVSLYLSTDGFPDQFGENGEKYQASGFTQLVESISSLDPSSQKEKLAAEFDQWKGANKQIDDVLVWGVKI